MVILGLILVLVAVVAAVVLVDQNGGTNTVDIHAFGGTWHAHAYWMAVVGAVILVVAVLGLALLRGGSRLAVRRRAERRALRRENAALSERVAAEPVRAERGRTVAGPTDTAGAYPAPPPEDLPPASRPRAGL